jgi:hypothetical protein
MVTGLSPKQQAVINDIFAEASELLGADAADLQMAAKDTEQLRLPRGTTYQQAQAQIANSSKRTAARDFTRAVLALRDDPRIQGNELKLPRT